MSARRAPRPEGASAELLEEWETFGRAAGWSENTVKCRRSTLELMCRTLPVPLEEATSLDLARWLGKYNTPATRHTYWKHLRSFFAFLEVAGYRTDDPTQHMKAPQARRGLPRPCTDQQLAAVLSAPSTLRRTRNYVLLGAYAGLRCVEIGKVRGEDVDADSLRVLGKGGVDARVPLHPRLVEMAAVMPREGYWFPGYRGQPHQTAMAVSLAIRKAFDNTGVHVTAHQLRHWFGTNVLRSSGGNLRIAQECLRHSSPATTAIYTMLDSRERSEAVSALPAL